MGLLNNLWDDVFAGPEPDFENLRKKNPLNIDTTGKENSRFAAAPGTPTTQSPSPGGSRGKASVWQKVFDPRTNPNTKGIGADMFDKYQPNAPSVQDWLYSPDTKCEYR